MHSMPLNRRAMLALLAGVWVLALVASACALHADDLSESDVANSAAQKALSRSPDIPWYDETSDDFRAAEVEPPKPLRNNSGIGAEILLRLGWVLLALLLLWLVYLIVRSFMTREIQESIVAKRSVVGADIARVEELPVSLAKSPADYLDEAMRLYRKSDFTQAIIYLFSHQLLQLDRRHWVRLVKGKTNRQYLREVRRNNVASSELLADLFNDTVLLFEEVFFGKRLPQRQQIDAVWSRIEQFESLVASAEEHAA